MAQLATKANSLVIAAFFIVFGVIALLYMQYDSEVRDAQLWVDHTYAVQSHIKDLRIVMSEAEASQRGYLLTGRDAYLAPYKAARDRSALLYGELKNLTADNSVEQDRLAKLSPLMQQKLALIASSIEAKKIVGGNPDLSELDGGRVVMAAIRDLLSGMAGTENELLHRRLEQVETVRFRTAVIAGTGAIAAILLLIVGGMMLRQAARDRRLADQAVRDAANQLRMSFDSLSQGIAVFDDGRRLTNWNQCFVSLLELPANLVQRGANYALISQALATTGDFFETEAQLEATTVVPMNNGPVVFQRRRGDNRVFELRRTMLPAGGFAITVTDITIQVRAEEVQRNSQRMQALGELIGGVAHDFNNLLTVIAGNLDLLQNRKSLDADAQRYVSGAMRGVDRGTSLTQHLLAFGRRQPLAPRPTDLNRLATEMTAGMLRRSLGERIDIKIIESAGLWPAFADPAQIENAILNLAINARDAMPEGGKLTIETANVTLDQQYAEQNEEVTPGQYVMIAVSDAGTGMPAEIVSRAFEPFFTTKDEGRGSGLGLAMVHGFAKQSKGHVKIYSEPGHGTSVKLYLPRSQRAVSEEQQSPATLPRGNATVLVVEDDADVRRIAVAQLTDLGYVVLDAGDAESGLKIFTDHGNIDLLLTDVVLPGRLRGRDLADLVSRASPTTKILFMSGYTENAIVHDGKLDEGTLLLQKPFRREDLAKKVAVALNLGEQPSGDNVVRLQPPH